MENEPSPPIFEIGVARSGTTILSLILDSHPCIAIPYESHFFVDYYRNREVLEEKLQDNEGKREVVRGILNEKYVKQWDYTPTLEEVDLSKCVDLASTIRTVFESYARYHGKYVWGDNTPSYISHINVLNELFPDSKFIHIVRDGRDVALSLMSQWFGPDDFVSALNFWRERVVIGRKMLSMLPEERVFTLKMEDLASEPESTLRALCDFLDISFTAEMLNSFNKKAAAKVGDRIDEHHAGLSGPLDIENVTKWDKELSKADQALAWEQAGSELRELGYPQGYKRHWAKPIRKIQHRAYEAIKWRQNRIRKSASG